MRSTTIVLALTALVLVVLASGCGGSGKAASGGGSGNSSAANRNDAELKFARCMRDHGIDVEDPKPGGGVGLAIRARRGDEKKLQEAEKACQKLLPGGFKEPSPEEQEKFKDAALAFARCMRAHGVEMPDPQFDKGRVRMVVKEESPRFKEAQKACEKLLPRPDREEDGS